MGLCARNPLDSKLERRQKHHQISTHYPLATGL
ncbi:hypothetical protein L917_11609 [Phytophthora nicotianae]|uniref:Uncharacterized protein n=1 Tax=Phytophthora nicotianae TaxID=4792 RepID=W2IQ82_PHYNI|nr:hypothetical protein L916_11750 [Phytophthora nicotianae]ETL89472.1 hypothetical protein L917_11609 [Phytophthora nicotianae]ETM42745.1 hypothetical protein L914_11662 [Phytophthora nicotianae]